MIQSQSLPSPPVFQHCLWTCCGHYGASSDFGSELNSRPSSLVYLSQMSTVLKARTASIVRTFIIYSDIPQMKVYQCDWGDLIHNSCSCRRGFHSSSLVAPLLGLSFGFDPTTVCNHPLMSVPCPGERGWKQQMIRAYLLKPKRGRDMTATFGTCRECLQWQRQAGSLQ